MSWNFLPFSLPPPQLDFSFPSPVVWLYYLITLGQIAVFVDAEHRCCRLTMSVLKRHNQPAALHKHAQEGIAKNKEATATQSLLSCTIFGKNWHILKLMEHVHCHIHQLCSLSVSILVDMAWCSWCYYINISFKTNDLKWVSYKNKFIWTDLSDSTVMDHRHTNKTSWPL